MTTLYEMEQSVNEANRTLSAANTIADQMARFIRNRLRHVSSLVLIELKRELSQFNARTGKWKN